jgi:hypothetical protein
LLEKVAAKKACNEVLKARWLNKLQVTTVKRTKRANNADLSYVSLDVL